MRREYYAVACKRLDAHDGAHQGYVYYTGAVACECYVCVNISTHAHAPTHTHTNIYTLSCMQTGMYIHTYMNTYIGMHVSVMWHMAWMRMIKHVMSEAIVCIHVDVYVYIAWMRMIKHMMSEAIGSASSLLSPHCTPYFRMQALPTTKAEPIASPST